MYVWTNSLLKKWFMTVHKRNIKFSVHVWIKMEYHWNTLHCIYKKWKWVTFLQSFMFFYFVLFGMESCIQLIMDMLNIWFDFQLIGATIVILIILLLVCNIGVCPCHWLLGLFERQDFNECMQWFCCMLCSLWLNTFVSYYYCYCYFYCYYYCYYS